MTNKSYMVLSYIDSNLRKRIKELNKDMQIPLLPSSGSEDDYTDSKGSIARFTTNKIYDILSKNGIYPPSRTNIKTKQIFPAAYVEVWARPSEGVNIKPTLDPYREDNDTRNRISIALSSKNYTSEKYTYPSLKGYCDKNQINKEKYTMQLEDIYKALDNSGIYDKIINTLEKFEANLEKNL